jgi:hypothetical protein
LDGSDPLVSDVVNISKLSEPPDPVVIAPLPRAPPRMPPELMPHVNENRQDGVSLMRNKDVSSRV